MNRAQLRIKQSETFYAGQKDVLLGRKENTTLNNATKRAGLRKTSSVNSTALKTIRVDGKMFQSLWCLGSRAAKTFV